MRVVTPRLAVGPRPRSSRWRHDRPDASGRATDSTGRVRLRSAQAAEASIEDQADPTTEAGRDGSDAGSSVGAANLTRAGLAEMIGTFFLIYTGTATAVAASLGRETGGHPPGSPALARIALAA